MSWASACTPLFVLVKQQSHSHAFTVLAAHAPDSDSASASVLYAHLLLIQTNKARVLLSLLSSFHSMYCRFNAAFPNGSTSAPARGPHSVWAILML